MHVNHLCLSEQKICLQPDGKRMCYQSFDKNVAAEICSLVYQQSLFSSMLQKPNDPARDQGSYILFYFCQCTLFSCHVLCQELKTRCLCSFQRLRLYCVILQLIETFSMLKARTQGKTEQCYKWHLHWEIKFVWSVSFLKDLFVYTLREVEYTGKYQAMEYICVTLVKW